MFRYQTLNDTIYFWFGLNTTAGAGGDGTTPLYDVRLGGAAASAAPVLSGTPDLLTNAAYTDGCYEIAVAATAGNGFAAGSQYGVFCTATISAVNPTGFVGGFILAPVISNVTQWLGTAAATPTVAGVPEVDVTHWLGTAVATPTVAGVPEVDITHIGGDAQSATDLKDFVDAGYDPVTNKVQGVLLTDTVTTYTGNTPQTGDVFGQLPANFAALIISGGGSIGFVSGLNPALLDAAVTSRMATYTQPTGFLAATFPGGTVANTTNITAGTLTTVTNLTNAATAGDFTSVMKASITTAVPTVAAIVTGVEAAIIPVNIKYVNDIEIKGVGTTIDPWNPV
jgi:hypothetical protein